MIGGAYILRSLWLVWWLVWCELVVVVMWLLYGTMMLVPPLEGEGACIVIVIMNSRAYYLNGMLVHTYRSCVIYSLVLMLM